MDGGLLLAFEQASEEGGVEGEEEGWHPHQLLLLAHQGRQGGGAGEQAHSLAKYRLEGQVGRFKLHCGEWMK